MPIVVNKTLRLISVRMAGFKLSGRAHQTQGYLKLLPSIENEVDDATWNKIAPALKRQIESGYIGVMGAKGIVTGDAKKADAAAKAKDAPKKVAAVSLKKMTPADATDVIKNTVDLATLKKWQKAETASGRKSLNKVLADQVKEVEEVEAKLEAARKKSEGQG